MRQIQADRHQPPPAVILLAEYRPHLRRCRADLIRDLRRVSRPLASRVSNLLSERDGVTPPAIGHVWPFFLADLAVVPLERVRQIAKAWLAIYAYTLILDAACDSAVPSARSDTLAGALLFEIGLGDLLTLSPPGSVQQQEIRSALRTALDGQERDVREMRHWQDPIRKRQSATDKNAGFLVCCSAVASLGMRPSAPLIAFTHRVLLSLQHLDDIADYREDWRVGNRTPLLSDLLCSDEAVDDDENPQELLEALVRSGALGNVLAEIHLALGEAVPRVTASYECDRRSASLRFLDELDRCVQSAIALTATAAAMPFGTPRARLALEEVDCALKIIAQQT